jgi:hypothetical protein
MHDWSGVASDALAAIFRGAEGVLTVVSAGLRFNNRKQQQALSNEALANRA